MSRVVPIQLRNRSGRVVATALVDSGDGSLARNPWYRLKSGYVVRTVVEDGQKRMLYLHREVLRMQPGDPREVDHIDRNPLNNRRPNLRVVSRAENSRNRGPNRGRHLPRNVYRTTGGSRLRVQVKVDGEAVHVGTFRDVETARWAAIRARIRYGVASVRDHQLVQEAKRVLEAHHGSRT